MRVATWFQSLLSWIGFKDRRAVAYCLNDRDVSILVVVDWVQRPLTPVGEPIGVPLFQSLLSWIGFKDVHAYKPSRSKWRVSILVVVDWVQRPGTCLISNTVSNTVSILVVVDWVQRRDHDRRRMVDVVAFQSLLSWIGFKDGSQDNDLSATAASFNPCCRGLGSKTRVGARQNWSHIGVSILVVVDWVQRLPHRLSTALSPRRCFNPCCRGLGSKTPMRYRHRPEQFQVSILVVVDWVQRRPSK